MDNKDTKDFTRRLEDKVLRVQRNHREETTDFLDPFMLSVGESFLKRMSDINFRSYGGVQNAERRRLVICPDYEEPDATMAAICLVELTGNLDYTRFSHGDCLGALLGQGIKRERVGDIYPLGNGFVSVLSQEVAQYILLHPPQLKGITLNGKIHEPGSWQPPDNPGKTITTTVPSLRLDAIVASGFGISRTKVVSDIRGGKVKVNWQTIENTAHQCKENDVISFRGWGRVVIALLKGETRKGRIALELLRYK